MSDTKFTPGPWTVGQYSDTMGCYCMTSGVRAGPVVLDGADYGQQSGIDMHIDDHFRMMADVADDCDATTDSLLMLS